MCLHHHLSLHPLHNTYNGPVFFFKVAMSNNLTEPSQPKVIDVERLNREYAELHRLGTKIRSPPSYIERGGPLLSACEMSLRFMYQIDGYTDVRDKARCRIEKISFAFEALSHASMLTDRGCYIMCQLTGPSQSRHIGRVVRLSTSIGTVTHRPHRPLNGLTGF